MTANDRPRVGVSACLLGARVRYDGGHKRNAWLVETLGRLVDWVPVCPEDEAGFGTPREPMRLQVARSGPDRPIPAAAVALVVIQTGEDVTARLRRYAERRVAELARDELSGFVMKKDSPSCGPNGVLVYGATGSGDPSGRGLFADAMMRRFPDLPIEDEERLSDPAARDAFVGRVLAYHGRHAFGRRPAAVENEP